MVRNQVFSDLGSRFGVVRTYWNPFYDSGGLVSDLKGFQSSLVGLGTITTKEFLDFSLYSKLSR